MKRGTRRFIIGLLSLILIIAIVGGVVGFLVIRRPFPQTDGNLYLPGLQASVDVYRDQYGVPHIFASNTHDLFMAQGFVHSQDRFWRRRPRLSAQAIRAVSGRWSCDAGPDPAPYRRFWEKRHCRTTSLSAQSAGLASPTRKNAC